MPCCATSTNDAMSADCVHVHSTTLVHCATKDADFPTAPIPLGPIEGLTAAMIPIAISFVYVCPPDTDAEAFIPAADMQDAMRHLLRFYPPLSGRLVLHDNGDRAVDRLDSGALFAQATCDLSLRELHAANTTMCRRSSRGEGAGAPCFFSDTLSMFDLPAGSNALFAPYSPAAEHIIVDPLFSLQHTRFACGSVALGVRLSHALTDAQGFFLAVQHLMELYGKLRAGQPSPTLTARPQWRAYLSAFRTEATAEEVAQALAYQPAIFYIDANSDAEAQANGTADSATPPPLPGPSPCPWPPSEVVGRELYFSPAQLASLKRRATAPDGRGWVSTFDTLNAYLWQCVYRARCAVYMREEKEEGAGRAVEGATPHAAQKKSTPPPPPPSARWPVTDFLTAVNLRERFCGSAAEAAVYFPASCFAPSTVVDPRVLRDGALHELAAAIHAMVHAPGLSASAASNDDGDAVRATVRWIAAQPDRTRIRTHFSMGGLMMSAWNKFDMYAAAACEGQQPVLVSTPFTNISLIDALGYILPCPPSFTPLPAGSDGCGSALAQEPQQQQQQEQRQQSSAGGGGGVIVYLALDASLWNLLSSPDLLGDYLHN